MYCYCEKYTATGQEFWLANDVKLEVSQINHEDHTSYCWLYIREMFVNTILLEGSAAITTIINSVIAIIFGFLGHYLVKHTTIETQVQSFSYILVLEFMNMGIIKMIQAFLPSKLLRELSGVNFEYQGFDYWFYQAVGFQISKAIFLSVILTNIREIKSIAKTLFDRLLDRNFNISLKKDPEDEDDDEPNSKKKTQSELEELYMGGEFEGERSFSRLMSHLLILITFSSGMPNLYFVGFLFFGFTFLVEKWNLVLILKKTTTLNRVIPLFSSSLFNFAILQHLVIGSFMMTNVSLFSFREDDHEGHVEGDGDGEIQKQVPSSMLPQFEQQHLKAVATRFKYFHQQLYFSFMIIAIFMHIGGKFFVGIVILIFDYFKKQLIKLRDKLAQLGAKTLRRKLARNESKMMLDKMQSNIFKQMKLQPQNGNEDRENSAAKLSSKKIGQNSSENSVDQSIVSQQDHGDVSKMKPFKYYLYAKELEPLDARDNNIDAKNSQFSKRIYGTKNIITSGKILIQLFAEGIKAQIDDLIQDGSQLTKQEIKRREEIMEKFKLISLEPNASDNIYSELSITNLIKFYKRAKMDFIEIQQFFNLNEETLQTVLKPVMSKFAKKDKLRITFEEICYVNKVTEDEVKSYLGSLECRIEEIESVIDSHLLLARESIIQEKREYHMRKIKNMEEKAGKLKPQATQQDPLDDNEAAIRNQENQEIIEEKLKNDPELQFETFTYEKKLNKLYEYENKLLIADRKQEANRKGIQTICRMRGSISQSYYILDQQDYAMASKIYYNEVKHPEINK